MTKIRLQQEKQIWTIVWFCRVGSMVLRFYGVLIIPKRLIIDSRSTAILVICFWELRIVFDLCGPVDTIFIIKILRTIQEPCGNMFDTYYFRVFENLEISKLWKHCAPNFLFFCNSILLLFVFMMFEERNLEIMDSRWRGIDNH